MATSSSAAEAQAATAPSTPFTPLTLEHIRQAQHAFASERAWHRYHTPRNLLLALTGEVGELAELFQWRGDADAAPLLPGWTVEQRAHVGDELSDVLLYLIRLSDVCGIDLGAAVERKIAMNALKYPADQAKGRSDKYTAYQQHSSGNQRRTTGQIDGEAVNT